MKVVVIFEFAQISDPNSPEANKVVDALTQDCKVMQEAFGATDCYVDDCVSTPTQGN